MPTYLTEFADGVEVHDTPDSTPPTTDLQDQIEKLVAVYHDRFCESRILALPADDSATHHYMAGQRDAFRVAEAELRSILSQLQP